MIISYNWLKSYVPDIPEPNRLADFFTYHVCEVESVTPFVDTSGKKDWIFDLGILPNRAHDLLSHMGVARELSGLLGIPFKDPTSMYKTPASSPTNLKVEIQSENCRRYTARIIRNVKVEPSPDWVVEHLESIGQRSINNIVDATNIVMYDCGQPTHAFDLKNLASDSVDYNIYITNAKEGEELKVVGRDGIVAKLKSTDLIIGDGVKTLALGGVKGGALSGISETTTDIVIEVANFSPVAIRKTARRLGLLSDSAKRFENDLSPSLCDFGMFSLSALFVELLPEALFEDIVDVYPNKQVEHTLTFSKNYVDKLLGIEIPEGVIENILTQYEFHFTKSESEFSRSGEPTRGPENLVSDGVNYNVKIPLLRLDLLNKEDMAEEIGRIYGLDKIKPVLPSIKSDIKINEVYERVLEARHLLVSNGYHEVMTYTFVENGDIEVLASASDKKFLRTNLTDGLKKSYELNKLNAPLLGLDEIKIFEIGTVFTKSGEDMHVAFANKKETKEMSLVEFEESFKSSPEFNSESTNIFLVKNFSAQHSRLAQDFHNQTLASNIDKTLGVKSEDKIFASGGPTRGPEILSSDETMIFKPWSAYPFITRDIAVWVPEEIKGETLKDLYKKFGTDLLQGEPILFDQFTKDGRTSYAFRLIFQSYDRTLTTNEINIIMAHITEKLSKENWQVR